MRVSGAMVIAGVILACVILAAAGLLLFRDTTPPNVILIVCDALRADHLGCYGYERDTSANIDAFAADSIMFRRAFAQAPATKPSMYNIVTSKYQSSAPVKDSYFTMAEYLKGKG